MPDPKRYAAKTPWYAIETFEHPIGEFVLYADYAKLKKEFNDWITMNSATTEHNEFMYNFAARMLANHPDFSYLLTQSKRIRELEAENANLRANVERLEKDVWRMKVFKGIDEDTKSTLKDALNIVPEWAKVLETIENNARLETENIELKAKVNQLTQVSEWQPIQTAPKNFTKILCLWPIKTAYRDSRSYWCRDEIDYWDKHEMELPEPILWKPLPEGWPNSAKEGKQS